MLSFLRKVEPRVLPTEGVSLTARLSLSHGRLSLVPPVHSPCLLLGHFPSVLRAALPTKPSGMVSLPGSNGKGERLPGCWLLPSTRWCLAAPLRAPVERSQIRTGSLFNPLLPILLRVALVKLDFVLTNPDEAE